jgi:hypothetical protein
MIISRYTIGTGASKIGNDFSISQSSTAARWLSGFSG